ncbi:MAG: EAL domain-containing protein [Gammaproteobacteria bacterium]
MRSIDDVVQRVAAEMGINGVEIDERKAYLEFTPDEQALLRSLHGKLVAARHGFVEEFYAHFLSFDATRALLDSEATLERVKDRQREYFDSLTRGDYGEKYVTDRLRVGLVHQRVGLEPKWYLGAYRKYLTGLLPAIWDVFGGDSAQALAAFQALMKVVFLDMGLALETYFHLDRQAIAALRDYSECIVCSVPAGLVVLSDELQVLSANRFVDGLLGADHQSLSGMPLGELFAGYDLAPYANEVLQTGRMASGIGLAWTDLQAARRRLELTISPMVGVANSGLTPVGASPMDEASLLLVIEDVTEKESLRAATRRADAHIRSILENVADGIITIDEYGKVESFNRAAESMFGRAAANVVGQNVKVLMPTSTRDLHDEYLAEFRRSGKADCLGAISREVEGLRADGTVFPMDLRVSELPLEDKRLFIGVVRDVSQRKRTELELTQLASAVKQTADMVVITDREGVIEYANQAFEAIAGYDRLEAVGQRLSMIKSGRHSKRFYRRVWQVILAGEVCREVFVNRKKDGTIYYEEKTISPLRDEQGIITHFVSTGRDITERIRAQEHLNYLAHHDALTELPNRTLFMDRLRRAIGRARRTGRYLAVLFLDLDRFKQINDTLGHEVGDRILQAIARRLSDSVRAGDTLARLGGDEFVLLVEDLADTDTIAHVVEKIMEAMAAPVLLEERDYFLTASIGVAVYPTDAADGGALLRLADVAMYQAKKRGRNHYQFYRADMNARAHERLGMENRLRRALSNGEFELHYQPKLDLRSGRIVGVEALIRWQSPELGRVMPGDFIPLLEETGLIVAVGRWVLREACRQARQWQLQGLDQLNVACNISGFQFHRDDLVDAVQVALEESGLDAQCLELELTESVLMEEADNAIETLARVKRHGVGLSIDDFGTGYSSLAYLKRFPIDCLKIDRAFVNDICHDPDDASIVSTILAMAQRMRLTVVAEGVETVEQLAYLRAEGCAQMQGYLLSPPVAASVIVDLVQRPGLLLE